MVFEKKNLNKKSVLENENMGDGVSEFRTLKLRRDAIYNCSKGKKECTEVHSTPVKVTEIKNPKKLTRILNDLERGSGKQFESATFHLN